MAKREPYIPTWKLVIFRVSWRAMRALITFIFSAANAVHWASLSTFEKSVIVMGGLTVAFDVVDSFFDQTIARMKAGQPAFSDYEIQTTPPNTGSSGGL